MNIFKNPKKTFILSWIGIGISFHFNFYCFGMENAIAKALSERDYIFSIFEKVKWTANNPGERVCELSSFAFTNKTIYLKFKEKYGNDLKSLKKEVRMAQLAPLLRKTLVLAPNGINNEEGQVRVPFFSAYENDSQDGCLDIRGFTHPDFNLHKYNQIFLKPEHFFESNFQMNIWLITIRAELKRYYTKAIKNNPNNKDPHGLTRVIEEKIQNPDNSMLVFFSFGKDNFDRSWYKYGEFGPLENQSGMSLCDYFMGDYSYWMDAVLGFAGGDRWSGVYIL